MDALPLIIRIIVLLLPLSLFFSVVLWQPFLLLIRMFLLLIKKVLNLIYIILDMIIGFLTNILGGGFYKLDNTLSFVFCRIDLRLQGYIAFIKKPENTKKRFMPIYLAAILLVYASSFYSGSASMVNAPYKLYSKLDSLIVDATTDMANAPNPMTTDEIKEVFNYELKVQGTTSSLLVRDFPRTKNCEIVDYVENGDTVSWNGVLTFGENDNKRNEAWVEVETASGITGWARLSYLVPNESIEGISWQFQKQVD